MITTPHTLVHSILNVANKTPEAPCLLAPDKRPLTFSQLMILIKNTHYFLNQCGFDSDTRIALLLPNTVEAAAAFLSVSATSTVIPLNPAATEDELKQYIQLIKPQAIITLANFAQKFKSICAFFNVPIIELISEDEQVAGYFALKGDTSNTAVSSNYVSANDIAMILLTSGSTAVPKIIPVTHQQYCQYLSEAVKLRTATANDRYLNLAYLHHLQGINGLCIPILVGGSCVCASHEKSLLSIDYFNEFSPTFYTALPIQHQQLLSQATTKSIKINKPLKAIITGSAAMSKKVAQALESLFDAPVIDTYGMSETLGICSNPLPPKIRKPGSVGIPFPAVYITLLDQNDEPITSNLSGEIVVNSPWMFSGYLENDDLNKTAFCQYGFRTGDVGYFDEDNYLFITGRVSETINRGGEKISPVEIDEALLAHINIIEAVTFAITDDALGEDVVCAIVSNDKNLTTELVYDFIKESLSSQKTPSQIIMTESIPKGSTGKIQRNQMAGHFKTLIVKNNKATIRQPSSTASEIHQSLASLWAKLLPIKSKIKVDESFFDLGGDSFLFFQLTVLVEKELGIVFPEYALLQGHTLNEQIAHLQSIINAPSKTFKNPTNLSNSDFKRLLSFAHGKEEQQHPDHPFIFPYNEHLSGIPLYFVSAGKYLAAHIKSRPTYDLLSGFNAINLDSYNMAALADYYVEALITLNPAGPYLLGGYCSGGLLAFEIAKRLLEQKKSVPLLIMVDQSLPYRYTGRLAFLPFTENKLIDELTRLEHSDILKDYYPSGWSLDSISSEHYPELYYMSAMIVAERIEARIQQSLELKQIKALAIDAKQVQIQGQLQQQDFENIVFNISVTNSSPVLWPAGQVCITYHWLSNLGRVILWAENKITINEAINPGERYSLVYIVEKLKESAKATLVFSAIDNFGTWFNGNCSINITREITSYNSQPTDLESIYSQDAQGHLTQAIQEYTHYLFSDHENSSNVLLKLAKAVRLARGAKQANDIYKQALSQHDYTLKETVNIHQELARNYASLGDFETSAYHAKKVLKINQNDYLSLSFIGLSYAHKKYYSAANNIFKKIMRELKDNYPEDIIFNITKFIEMISVSNKSSNYIYTFCKKLIKHNPYNLKYYYILGTNLQSIKKYKEAELVLISGIALYPYVSFGYEMLHNIYIQQKQFSKAIVMKYKLCELKPFCIEQHKQLIDLLIQEQRIKDAEDAQIILDTISFIEPS